MVSMKQALQNGKAHKHTHKYTHTQIHPHTYRYAHIHTCLRFDIQTHTRFSCHPNLFILILFIPVIFLILIFSTPIHSYYSSTAFLFYLILISLFSFPSIFLFHSIWYIFLPQFRCKRECHQQGAFIMGQGWIVWHHFGQHRSTKGRH